MKQQNPITTPRDLELWMERHGVTVDEAVHMLGKKRRILYYYLSGEHPIPQTIANLCALYDKDLAKIPRRR